MAASDPRRSEPSSESAALGRAEAQTVLAAVDRLPERDRLVIAYRFLLELTEAETAEALGVPPGTVKSRLSRGLQRLRAELDAGVVEVEQA